MYTDNQVYGVITNSFRVLMINVCTFIPPTASNLLTDVHDCSHGCGPNILTLVIRAVYVY